MWLTIPISRYSVESQVYKNNKNQYEHFMHMEYELRSRIKYRDIKQGQLFIRNFFLFWLINDH